MDVISANKKLEIIERYDTIDEFKNGCKNDFNCKVVYNTSNYGLYSLDQHETFLCNYEFLQSFYKAFSCSTIITKESSIDECPFVYLPLIQYILQMYTKILINVNLNYQLLRVNSGLKIPILSGRIDNKLSIKLHNMNYYESERTISYSILQLILNLSNFSTVTFGLVF